VSRTMPVVQWTSIHNNMPYFGSSWQPQGCSFTGTTLDLRISSSVHFSESAISGTDSRCRQRSPRSVR